MKDLRFCRIGPAFMIFLIFMLLSACGPVISKNLKNQAEPDLTFQEVFQKPEAYKGEIVIWGGEIIQTINQKDGTTLIEISQRSLDWQEEPKEASSSGDRFLVLVKKHLDPFTYGRGKEITVAGKILGEITKLRDQEITVDGKVLGEKPKLPGEVAYRYPYLLAKQVFLWRKDYPYYYDLYGPWWFYNPLLGDWDDPW